MPIVLNCPVCKVQLTFGDERAGTKFRCPKCDNRIAAPQAANVKLKTDQSSPNLPLSKPVKPPPTTSPSVPNAPLADIAENFDEHKLVSSGHYQKLKVRRKLRGKIASGVVISLALFIVMAIIGFVRAYNFSEGVSANVHNMFALNSVERKLVGNWKYNSLLIPEGKILFRGDGTYTTESYLRLVGSNEQVTGKWSLIDGKLMMTGLELLRTYNGSVSKYSFLTSSLLEIVSANDKHLVLKNTATNEQIIYSRVEP